jgi:NTP pyrophosphatase (non-canonical NTP hydrolase)
MERRSKETKRFVQEERVKAVLELKPINYAIEAGVTDHKDYSTVVARIADDRTARLIHYALGIGSEAGELQDALKKYVAYGKPLDLVNLKEEVGDLLWYIARICDTAGFSIEDAMETNIAKLKARYGHKWTQQAALNRDLEKEREILEK